MQVLGIDVGGSGIKGAPVDTKTGKLLAERVRIKTPKGADPQPVADVVAEIAKSFKWTKPIGVGFPAPIKGGGLASAGLGLANYVNACEHEGNHPQLNGRRLGIAKLSDGLHDLFTQV